MSKRSWPRARLWLGVAVFGTALTIAVLRVTPLPRLFGLRLHMPWAMNDFKTAIYCPTAMFLNGGNPYDQARFVEFCPVGLPFPPYLPATMVLHAPFGFIPMDLSAFLYFGCSVALSVMVVWLALRLSGAEILAGDVLFGTGLLLLSRPGQWNLLLGQPAHALTLVTYAALYLARRVPYAGGLAAAVAAFKPSFGLPLIALLLARRDFRAAFAAMGFTVILNLPPALQLADRAGGMRPLLGQLFAAQSAYQLTNSPVSQVYSIDLPSLISRLSGHWIGAGGYLLVALGVLTAGALAIRAVPAPTEGAGAHLTASIICLAVLVGIHHNAYDLVLLTGPAILLAKRALPAELVGERPRVLFLSLYALLGANYVTTLSVLHRLEPRSVGWMLLASLNSLLLLVIFLGYTTLTILHRPAGARSREPA